jgi:hypothetical protein
MNNQFTDSADIPGLPSACPYLGLKGDVQSFFSTPNQGNYCHRVAPSRAVSFDQQTSYCLSGSFNDCEIFKNNLDNASEVLQDAVSASVFSNQEDPERGKGLAQGDEALTGGEVETFPETKPMQRSATGSTGGLDDSGAPVEDSKESSENVTWDKLHEEVKGRYQRVKPGKNKKFLLAALIGVALVTLLLAGFWLLGKVRGDRYQDDVAMLSSSIQVTVSGNDQNELLKTVTATQKSDSQMGAVLPSATPTPAERVPNDELLKNGTTTASPEPTATLAESCSDQSGYKIEVVSGPDLTPKPGYIFRVGSPEPFFQASWLIKNTGKCDWQEIALQDMASGENLMPIIKRGDQIVDLAETDQVINSGEEIEIILRFRAKDAQSIDRSWGFILNQIYLSEQPILELEVEDWVTIVRETDQP